ncbi:adenylyltransferase/cytidyltransferase family protein [Candidatus Daviesbacteria bacterium]|nr:adenylyltransferase/cytidyltransferase family protein [Candidatus Daviesbacteria bacterium]
MGETLSIKRLVKIIPNLKKQDKTIVLAGGCFDVLHPGHVVFLEKAKKAGDILIVILESDEKVKKLKGANRPIHTQKERAKVLSALKAVDYVVMLPFMELESSYDELIQKIKPDIIAVTRGQANIAYHKRAAAATQADLKYVTEKVGNHSTSTILNH